MDKPPISENQGSRYLASRRQAISSSYLIQQSPGGERVGGLEIRLCIPKNTKGVLLVENTIWGSEDRREDLGIWALEATRGIHDYADKKGIDIADFDITLSRFIVHEVDSMPYLYYVAAQNAFASAIKMWAAQLPDD